MSSSDASHSSTNQATKTPLGPTFYVRTSQRVHDLRDRLELIKQRLEVLDDAYEEAFANDDDSGLAPIEAEEKYLGREWDGIYKQIGPLQMALFFMERQEQMAIQEHQQNQEEQQIQ